MSDHALELSVVIPTVGGARLNDTLASLRAQPDCRIETIVVFDGARPAPASCPADVRILEQPRSGPARARNLGARHAAAPLLLFLDDDCPVDPGSLRVLIQRLQGGGTLAVGGTPRLPTDASLWSRASHVVTEAFFPEPAFA